MGYDVRERKLVINQDEARTVREIFERHLELGSVRELKNDLDQLGIVSAVKLSLKGKQRGGKPFSRGALYCLLSNRIYRGEIRHKQQSHPGQHEPIINRELWERVQAKLFDRNGARRRGAQDRGNAKSAGGQAVRCERRAAVRPRRGQGSTTLSLLRVQESGERGVTGTGAAVAAGRARVRASSLSRRPDDTR